MLGLNLDSTMNIKTRSYFVLLAAYLVARSQVLLPNVIQWNNHIVAATFELGTLEPYVHFNRRYVQMSIEAAAQVPISFAIVGYNKSSAHGSRVLASSLTNYTFSSKVVYNLLYSNQQKEREIVLKH